MPLSAPDFYQLPKRPCGDGPSAVAHRGAGVGRDARCRKDELKFGFIKLTDMAPLAIAYEKGYFEDEGLYVTLEPQANWKVLLDRCDHRCA